MPSVMSANEKTGTAVFGCSTVDFLSVLFDADETAGAGCDEMTRYSLEPAPIESGAPPPKMLAGTEKRLLCNCC